MTSIIQGFQSGLLISLLACNAWCEIESTPEVVNKGHKDFEYTTMGKKAFVQHAALSGSYGHLDGPATQGMAQVVWGVDSDRAGNIYFFDPSNCALRAVRKRDGRLFTLSGNRYTCYGRPGAKKIPADRLVLLDQQFIDMPTLAAVGNPLEGEGSLYFTGPSLNVIVRLWREKDVWQAQVVGGLGDKAPASGVPLAESKLYKTGVYATTNGEWGITSGGKTSRHFYWVRKGKLEPAYDQKAVMAQTKSFYCHGMDGAGNFVGLAGAYTGSPWIWVVGSGGKGVTKIPTPYVPRWVVTPDRKLERWFFRGMDDYGIQMVKPDGTPARFGPDGVWRTKDVGHRGVGAGKEGQAPSLNWSRGNAMLDGRYVGWATGSGPIFSATWLEGSK